jgi:hypothetical protein
VISSPAEEIPGDPITDTKASEIVVAAVREHSILGSLPKAGRDPIITIPFLLAPDIADISVIKSGKELSRGSFGIVSTL